MQGCGYSAGNVSGLRAALRHLEAGWALAVFPSGVVSHRHARSRCVTDPAWNALVGRLARVAGVSTAPIYFEGRNSLLFQAAGCVHSVLRTMLLPREMWRMRGHNVRMRVGKAVETSVLSALADDEGRTAYIRACCYALKRKKAFAAVPSVPVASPGAKDDLLREIHAVRGSLSAEEGNFQVLRVRGDEAPGILHEIGRQREKTFRNAHEGSGKAVDIDRFDEHYVHLVLWDKAAERLAGSYRVRIFSPEDAWRNRKTLYTASLFRFKAEFFERCGLSMELGRAFIASEYQRDYAPLMLLWKGTVRRGPLKWTR